MPGSSTKTKSRSRDSITFASLQMVGFDTVAAVAISQTAATIQTQLALPFTCKIFGALPTFTAISGASSWNVAAGLGTYETAAGANATASQTVAGTVAVGYTYTVTFNVPIALAQAIGVSGINTLGILGNPLVAGQVSMPVTVVAGTSPTATTVAAQIVAAINTNNILENLVNATNAAGVITYTFLQGGTAANSVTVLGNVQGVGGTFTASATFSGGTATTGVVPGVNDQFEYNGTTNFAPAGAGALGATPIFNIDMPMVQALQGAQPYVTSNWDTVYQQGSILTLRVITGGASTITNLKVMLALMPHDPTPASPTFATFDPHLHIN